VIVAHVFGIPVEESVLQLAGTGMATATFFLIVGRASIGRLRRRRPGRRKS
jgi:hypothetical protein